MDWTRNAFKKSVCQQSGCFLAALSCSVLLGGGSVIAADPFRVGTGARPMGFSLERAFEDFFRNGSYLNSTQKLRVAQTENPKEPLVYSLQAALAYLNEQPDRVLLLAQKTQQVAQSIRGKDSARSHLYWGIGKGLEGASYYLKDGDVGLLKALPYAGSMVAEIDKAQQLAPNDPEVNLVAGYVGTVLAKQNLKSYEDALASFRKAGPAYLALRGQALVYRDTKHYAQAQTMVEKAIADAPQNPDLLYLKGQILALQQKPVDAINFFDRALSLGKQLPESTKKQIRRERSGQLSKVTQGKV
jgi:tetratricopeptide (TPR) repeat protein